MVRPRVRAVQRFPCLYPSLVSLEADKERLSKLTVIVPTWNRPKDLSRILSYWGRWPVSIIVLDGSDTPRTIDQLDPGLANLTLHSEVDFARRIQWAARNIGTPYACLQPDDDFILCRSAARAIQWLDDHERFSCIASHGQFFTPTFDFLPSNQGRWLCDEDPHQRLVDHFRNYTWSYVYGIQRSFALSASLEANSAPLLTPEFLEYPLLTIFEYGMEIAGALLGPLACGSDVMLLKAVGNAPPQYQEYRWDTWLENPITQTAATSWRVAFSQALASYVATPADELSLWIVEILLQQVRGAESNPKKGPFYYASDLPIPKHFTGPWNVRFRPKSHTSSDHRVGLAKRMLRKAHRLAFRLVRATYRTMATMGGRPVGKLPDSDWNWGDPDDMADFWRSIDGDDDAKG